MSTNTLNYGGRAKLVRPPKGGPKTRSMSQEEVDEYLQQWHQLLPSAIFSSQNYDLQQPGQVIIMGTVIRDAISFLTYNIDKDIPLWFVDGIVNLVTASLDHFKIARLRAPLLLNLSAAHPNPIMQRIIRRASAIDGAGHLGETMELPTEFEIGTNLALMSNVKGLVGTAISNPRVQHAVTTAAEMLQQAIFMTDLDRAITTSTASAQDVDADLLKQKTGRERKTASTSGRNAKNNRNTPIEKQGQANRGFRLTD